MKISWGYKITILYAGFVALIICMVTLAMRQKVDLVSKDYYEQELQFQEKINKTNRANALEESLTWEIQSGELKLNFPCQFNKQIISGSVYFFRPSDDSMDKTITIPADTLLVKKINTLQLKKGAYKMQVSWEVNKVEYYNEGIIYIN